MRSSAICNVLLSCAEDSVLDPEHAGATYRRPLHTVLVHFVESWTRTILTRTPRFIYNDLQGRNQKEAVHHIAEQGLAARKGWTLAAPRLEVGGLQHPPGMLDSVQW